MNFYESFLYSSLRKAFANRRCAVPATSWKHSCLSMTAGIGVITMIITVAWWLAQTLSLADFGIGPLSLALFIGILLGNAHRLPAMLQPGIHFAQQKLLRAGIMLFGLHVSIEQLLHVGGQAFAIDLIVITTILIGGTWLGIRVFRLEHDLAVMIAAGSAICGAAAVVATEPVVRGSSAHTSMAVATVVIFGSLAMLIYPLIFHITGATPESFGIYTGATVHEVAQVVAIGHGIGDNAAQTAVIVKLLRVMLLAPVLMLLTLWWRSKESNTCHGRSGLTIPWFAFGFIVVVIINSSWSMPPQLHQNLALLDTLMLSAAMAALGLETRLDRMRQLGLKPLLFAGVLFLFLMTGGGILTQWLL